MKHEIPAVPLDHRPEELGETAVADPAALTDDRPLLALREGVEVRGRDDRPCPPEANDDLAAGVLLFEARAE